MREQLWMLPGGDPRIALRATVFRPADVSDEVGQRANSQHPLVVINHGTSEWTREAVSMPVYYWLSRWFVERGYVVVLPQRRGHGSTGGALVESVGHCANPDHFRSGQIAADDIEAAVKFMSAQPFVAPGNTLVVGISTGGWASLALASRNVSGVRAVINIAGGRGGHAGGRANAVCAPGRLIAAAGLYGKMARTPTLWLYAENDSYFGPGLARSMAEAWRVAGGAAELDVLPSYGAEGHDFVDDQAGWTLWGPVVDGFLNAHSRPMLAVSADAR